MCLKCYCSRVKEKEEDEKEKDKGFYFKKEKYQAIRNKSGILMDVFGDFTWHNKLPPTLKLVCFPVLIISTSKIF